MVSTPAEFVEISKDLPRFIYITGCDGTGKTTQTRLLLAQLQAAGIKTYHVWLRFPFFLSSPLLAYARWRGYSWYEVTDGVRNGYWDFRSSWLMRNIFPWLLLIDAALASLWKIYRPLWAGRTVVCERFVVDILVDLAVALGEHQFYSKLSGRWFARLLPADAKVIILDLDSTTIQKRRADLLSDRLLTERLEAFRALGIGWGLTMLSSAPSLSIVNSRVRKSLEG